MVKPASDKVICGIKKIVLPVVFKYLPRDEVMVFLFGSQVTKDGFGASDIDLGLLSSQAIKGSKLGLIKDEIEQQAKTLRKIDVVDFASVDDQGFLKQALGRIKIWHQTKKSKKYLDNLKKRLAA